MSALKEKSTTAWKSTLATILGLSEYRDTDCGGVCRSCYHRDRQQHDQTAAWIIALCKKGLNAEPRDDSPSDHPQRDDALGNGFLQSILQMFVF